MMYDVLDSKLGVLKDNVLVIEYEDIDKNVV